MKRDTVNLDPITVVKEIVNLKNLMEERLAKVSQMAAGGNHTSWDIRSKVPGWSPTNPLERWKDKTVMIDGMEAFGSARIIAVKKVGSFYIPGVMFHVPVTNGHSLSMRDAGDCGSEGFCLWAWLDQLKVVNS